MKINPTAAYHAYNKISEHLRPARMEETAGQPVQTGKTIRSRSALRRHAARKWSSMHAL